jgi:chaperonin GroEL
VTSYAKVKSASKTVHVRSPSLDELVLKTLDRIARIVGATLGPGGAAVLIERQEFGLAPMVSKDGVTVFQSLGFDDAPAHAIMESARDAAVKTVSEAGDGTTTATVLAWALVKYAQQYHRDHPEFPPQRIVERLRDVFEEKLLPRIERLARRIDYTKDADKRLVRDVACISANGDQKLADAVMECFDLVGDQGTVTISERSGPPGYLVEKIEGYPVPVGYEDSCAKFMQVFMNDPQNSRAFLGKPYFILYNGVCTDVQALYGLLDRMQGAWMNRPGAKDSAGNDIHDPSQAFLDSPNIVLVANGFSEQVLGTLALNFREANTINVLPLVTPRSALQNGEAHFLDDVSAITGSEVLDPLQRNFDRARIPGEEDSDIGQVQEFEMLRFRSTIIGYADEDLITDRAEVLEGMVRSAISELDSRMLRERLACLTGGIAKLWVIGGSQGELRERKDRADDAVRAVQGAIKHGVLPGGGWTLVNLSHFLYEHFEAETPERDVLAKALLEPVEMLLTNTGMTKEDARATYEQMVKLGNRTRLWNAATRKWVSPYTGGVLDSTPAVREAIRNSISIASLLGTLGGLVVFKRDQELERRDAQDTNRWLHDTNAATNEANERW